MNAADAIHDAFTRAGWTQVMNDDAGQNLHVRYMEGTQMVEISYRLYGSGNSYLMRYYGKDPLEGINWGVERATLRWWQENNQGNETWQVMHRFEGKNKKGQLVKFAQGKVTYPEQPRG